MALPIKIEVIYPLHRPYLLSMKMLMKSWGPTPFIPKIMKLESHRIGSQVVFFVLDRNIGGLYSSIEEHLRPSIGYNPSPTSLYLHAALKIIIV